MRIAVNASSFIIDKFENDTNSVYEIFLNFASSKPKHTFIFIFDKSYQQEFIFPENVIPLVIGPVAISPIKWRIWYNIKIPAALKKYKADIFISTNFCSLKTKIPQLLISPDLTFIHQPLFINKKYLHFYQKYTHRFLDKSSGIVVHSQFSKKELIDLYKINEDKIQVIYHDVDEHFKPLNHNEKELIKEKYADGNEFFIYKGIISPQQNLMNLLKAFSAFKKRQKSKMQLIIAGNRGIEYEKFLESLKLYRFNKEVKVLKENELKDSSKDEIQKVIASAYSMVYVPVYETSFPIPFEAMKCDVPLIASSTGALPEICSDAALYADPENFKDIAEKMMMLFKDENLRKEFIEKGKVRVKQFRGNKTQNILFETIEDLVKKNPLS